MTTETNAERLAHIQYQIDDARLHGGMYSSTHVELEWLIEQAERAQELETELKETIAKKNRHLKDKDKRIKELEWSNMIHKNGHGSIYAELHELKESLKRGASNA
ncbi:hypothetical protein [Sporosarcina sp. ITBMC105]